MRVIIVLYLLLAGCCEYRVKASYQNLLMGTEIELIVQPGGNDNANHTGKPARIR